MVAMLALLFLSTICSGRTTHYIRTTPSTQCPAQPCLTLSEYAQRLPQYLTSNITLLLLPGDHVLHVNFTVENVTDFDILSSSPAANSAAKIVCKGLVSILFRNTSHMAMHGLTFNSWASVQLHTIMCLHTECQFIWEWTSISPTAHFRRVLVLHWECSTVACT